MFQLMVLGIIILPTFCSLSDVDYAMVISSTVPPSKERSDPVPTVPEIYEMRIRSTISNRFANTVVISKVRNLSNLAKEISFAMLLPESAFVSGFVMEVGGINYTAYVKEKEEAKRIYNEAVGKGAAAAHVSARDSNRFTVSVNISPEDKATFYLTYEQLLVRTNGLYEQIINIHPGQPVKNLEVEVVIMESRKITRLKAPPLRSGNEVGSEKLELDPRADIETVNDTTATVTFNPNLERQKQLAHIFGTKEENGLVGQFVVQYDVERDPHGGEVLVQDGYFVHFFAPTELEPLPKQVVFILDTSGSMRGQRVQQLKEAMYKILDQLEERDSFNLVEFNTNARVWDLDDAANSVWYPHRNNPHRHHTNKSLLNLQDIHFPRAYSVNHTNIENAKKTVAALRVDGSTAMCGALKVGLRLVEVERMHPLDSIERQPIIIFLTDGQPTDLTPDNIISQITEYNSEFKKSAIFALAFGEGVDRTFLNTLAVKNSGYAKPIYVAADASLQLQDFYRQIASPLLSNVTFKYEPSVNSLTKTEFPIHFGGSEIVVAGFCGATLPSPTINGVSTRGLITLKPSVGNSVSNMERLWAYLSIHQLLERKDVPANATKARALELALKYSFVTPVSSLVVVKPNETATVDTEEVKLVGRENRPMHSPRRGTARSRSHAIKTNTEPRSTLDRLINDLPWLKPMLSEGSLQLPQGTYKLGINETINDLVTCPKTFFNKEGQCVLLHECYDVHRFLKTSSDYLEYFCLLKNEFAGICC